MFVSTRASEHVFNCIREKQSVTVTGNPGVGKTTTMRYVALKMKKEGYTVVPLALPVDIRDFSEEGKNMLFVVDDVCGNYTLDQNRLDKWKELCETIQSLLDHKYCKIISTCRLQIFKDVRLGELPFLKICECNLNSNELCLTCPEKRELTQIYFKEKADKVSVLEEYDYFPLLCALYQKSNCQDINYFLKTPYDFYKKEFDILSHSDCEKDKYKVCVLVLCVIFNNRFKEKYLTTKKEIIQKTLQKCKINKSSSFENFYCLLNIIEGNLVVKVDEVYSAIHDTLYDFMAYYFGGKMSELIIENAHCDFISDRFLWKANDNRTENITYTIFIKDEQIDIYIKRILRDWSEGKVLAVFKNRNMKSPSFNAKLIDHLSRHDHSYQENLAHMRDEYIQDSTLLQSCFLGDPDLTRWILKHTVGDSGNSSKRQGEIDVVNMCRQDGSSPLLIACQNHHTEIVEMLLESEADINKCRDSGAPPLYMACQNGHLDIVEKLLDKKVNTDVNKCTNNGGSPLYIACQKGHVKIVKILLTNGADINNSLKDGSLPLHVACNFNHIDVVEEILEVQNPEFDIDLCDNKGWTSLYFACEKGYTNIARILLEHHADPRKCNINGYSPFIVAEHNGLKEILDIIEQHSSHEIR